MKHLHFFGCSFTAGDELFDDEYFPWKSECKTMDEYYHRRGKILADPDTFEEYVAKNKTRAYPSKLDNENVTTYNHARNGASVQECIFRLMKTILEGRSQVDRVFLQLPPFPREFYIDGNYRSDYPTTETSIALSAVVFANGADELTQYAKIKTITHYPYQFAVEDFMDIITLTSFLKFKNIPFHLISFGYELRSRLMGMPDCYKFLADEFLKTVPILDLTKTHDFADRLLGGHYAESGHIKIARELRAYLTLIGETM